MNKKEKFLLWNIMVSILLITFAGSYFMAKNFSHITIDDIMSTILAIGVLQFLLAGFGFMVTSIGGL